MFQVIILDCGCNQMVIFQIHSLKFTVNLFGELNPTS